jgi:cobalt-zinc-cadmium efflux system protein
LFSLALNGGFFVIEAVTGWITGSLVLIADAGHMATDVAALAFALVGIWIAARPATAEKTFGYYRVEILAALLNGLLLFGVSGFILFEAASRISDPPHVSSVPLLVVASLGLVVNLVPALLLRRGAAESLTVKSAFLDMLGDAVASGAAIVAGLIMLTTSWRYADPIFAAGIGLLILPRTWGLLRESADVLLEAAPKGLDLSAVRQQILSVEGVESVHGLHVWTITSGFVALSGHVLVADGANRDHALTEIRTRLLDGFKIEHVTLQLETEALEVLLGQPCLAGDEGCFVPESEASVHA